MAEDHSGFKLLGDIEANNKAVTLTDNAAAAFEIKEGANSYLKFVTTDAGEKIQIGKPLDMVTNAITNCADPTNAQDVDTKNARDAAITTHTAVSDAHHAKYTDAEARDSINDIFGSDGKADIDIDLDSHKLINVTNPAAAQDAATKNYVDDNFGDCVPEVSSNYLIFINSANLGSTPFIAQINGAPTPISVVYDGDTNENSLNGWDSTRNNFRLVLHNTTRNNSRLVSSIDRATNTFTTVSSTDDWADNDNITAESQTNAGTATRKFYDIDLSNWVPANAVGFMCFCQLRDDGLQGFLRLHPYESYDGEKMVVCGTQVVNQLMTMMFFVKVVNQKITMNFQSHDGGDSIVGVLTQQVYFTS